MTLSGRKKIVTVFFRPSFSMSLRLRFVLPEFLLLATGLLSVSFAAGAEAAKGEIRDGPRADYMLQPQDIVRVQVYQEEDINRQGEVRVSQENTITLPLIGVVDLTGKTVRQAEVVIRELYDRDYLVNPHVTVTVVKYNERVVKVFGAVNNPGPVPVPPEGSLTFMEAISRAGGFNRYADQKRVTLTRTAPDGTAENRTINVAEILKGGPGDVVLQPNDSINVPEKII